MKPKQIARCLVDFGMTALLLGLMAYSVTGQAVHEWMGVAAFLLFVVHHGLNGDWIRSLRKGRYTPARVLQTVLALLLLVSMLVQMISGIAMSRHALPFLDVPLPASTARLLHLACGYWSFLLVSLHLGFHWGIFLGLGRKLRDGHPLSPAGRIVARTLAGAAAAWGVVCFVQQNIVDYLFLRTEFVFFDYEKPPLMALAELTAMMALWTLVGYLLQRLAVRQVRQGGRTE